MVFNGGMSIFTLAEIEEQITAYKNALKACAAGQEVQVDGERMTRADLPEIRKTLSWLGDEKRALQGSRSAVTVIGRPSR